MERTKINKQPDLILTADWHLREDQPVCRTDSFEETQWQKVQFISKLQEKYKCPVIHAGDLYNQWKPSPSLLSKTMSYLPEEFYTIYGNHDLPQHNLELRYKSGVHTLFTAEKLGILSHTHWGKEPPTDFGFPSFKVDDKKILVWHTMTWSKEIPWPGCTDPNAKRLLKKHSKYDLILTGHNHKAFTVEHEGRLLVNPGSITRQDADQMDFKPRVYLYYAYSNTAQIVYLPIDDRVISREHLDKIKDRDNRIDAFVSKLDTDFEGSIDFEGNLNQLMQANSISPIVQEIIIKSLDD